LADDEFPTIEMDLQKAL
jgi:cell division septum initiation protein DivIVA